MDRTRSGIPAADESVPKNTEIEVILTFANEAAGGARLGGGRARAGADRQQRGGRCRRDRAGAAERARGGGRGGGMFSGTIASVTPTANGDMREHYSLVELPDKIFSRATTIRAGSGG